ncbi:MAG: GMC family oxidoreductase, partial [Pseudomonadota bacterium]
MHIQAHKQAEGHVYEAEICLIGAGAAGSVMAHRLAELGKQVLLIEAGSLKHHAGSQSLYAGESSDPQFHLPPDRDRTRGLGGTSSQWGGRCMPYDPIDFDARAHIAHSGWPISRLELDPFFARAQQYAECGVPEFDAAQSGLPGRLIEGFSSEDVCTESLERWSPPVNFGTKLKPELIGSPNVTLVTGATCTGLHVEDMRVTGADLRTIKGGKKQLVRAKRFVLCGGGLEVTRLLLNSATGSQAAIGNHSGWLGRGYMCHVGGVISRIRFKDGVKVVFGYETDNEGVFVRRRITLSPEAQSREKLLNMYALFDRPLLSDSSHDSAVLSLLYLVKGLFQRHADKGVDLSSGRFAHYKRHVKNLIFGAPEVLTVLPKFGRDRFLKGRRMPSLLLSSTDNVMYLYFHSEQSIQRDSRVELSDQTDRFGQRQLRVAAKLAEEDVAAIERAHRVIAKALSDQGVGTLEFLQEDVAAAIRACKCTLGHHIGTTRMAGKPEEGVVDANAQVFGVKNLYVASGSVLPTSSQAHPTLTILALALRLCEHIAGL